MRNCSNVSVGAYIPGRGCSSIGGPLTATPGKSVLFSPESPQGYVYSPSFTIVPGQIVLIDAYNLTYDLPIYVNRVLISTTGAGTGDNCDPCAMGSAYGSAGVITFRERMSLGRDIRCWELVKYSTEECEYQSKLQLMIAVPGTYELELSDASMLGDMQVEYQEWTAVLTPTLPPSYHAGIYCATDCGDPSNPSGPEGPPA